MKKIIHFSILILALVLCFNNDAYGQRSKKKKSSTDEYFDESGGFVHRLWYGGGFNLGFSGNSLYSSFQLGISPMVGYKITEQFSVGPRVALNYTYFKAELGNGQVENAQPMSWAGGLFARYKFIYSLFGHVEYELENEAFIRIDFDELTVLREEKDNFYLGVGYNSGNGLWGYELLLLYNILEEKNSVDLPISIRFGITYNF